MGRQETFRAALCLEIATGRGWPPEGWPERLEWPEVCHLPSVPPAAAAPLRGPQPLLSVPTGCLFHVLELSCIWDRGVLLQGNETQTPCLSWLLGRADRSCVEGSRSPGASGAARGEEALGTAALPQPGIR